MKRIHVFNNVEMRFGLWKYTFLVMQKYGHDESVPYAGGVFATNFVGVRHVIGSLSAAVGVRFIAPAYTKTPT